MLRKSTSKTIRKLGTLADLSKQLHTDREGVLAWANEQARLETLKYKSEKEDATVMIPFHSNRFMDYHKQKLFLAVIFSSIHLLWTENGFYLSKNQKQA